MEKDALKQYLSGKYQGWDSFCDTVIFPIFGKEDYDDKHKKEVLDMRPERRLLADATGIRSIKFCGQTYVSGEPFQFFDITVADKVMMERNRVNVQKIIRSVMDQYSSAFMIFHYDDEERWEWRFSFCYKSANEEESTDRKRYTFLLGPGQSCRTAAENFLTLYNKHKKDEEIEIDDIIQAFNVEALSKEFFDGYKKIYEDIIQYATGKRMVKVVNKWEEEQVGDPNPEIMNEFSRFLGPEKAVRDYVKKLMGRLVFLQFLQKKGWLGVPVNKQWGSGDQEFIQKLFVRTEDKDHFVDNVLEPLFNDLNTERTDDIVSPAVGSNIRVPYLNGGLFERDAADETQFPLPDEYMGSLLEFFSWYNFTIDENDPNDAEVGVDPEMLGRIFENLLEDNKDKGAFYTPKEIVSYMCRESLIAYLQTDIEDEPTKDAIREFVTTHDTATLGNIADDIDQRLKDVKICDPAIGSGAFPMGLLKELFQCRTALEGISQHQAAEIKKHIIQQNIYGVDIERGAVDIARLRFWLSLIVDEETPQALPNLDFKIMQGNSLLEQYKGVDLSTMTDITTERHGLIQLTWFDNQLDDLRRRLRRMLTEYYDCTYHQVKQSLRKEIVENVKQQLQEQSINVDFGDLDLAGNNQFMLWHTWFYDVFSQGGFDIVIANPPYVDAKKLKTIAPNLKQFKVFNGSADLYTYFYELAHNMLSANGIMTFITSNKWIRSEYGRKLRKLFLENEIVQLIDFGRNRLFGATVDSNIISIKKAVQMTQPLLYYFDENTEGSSLMEMLNYGEVKNVHLSEDAWLLKAGENDKLKTKIESHGIPLINFGVNIFRGILTGFNKAYHVDEIEMENLINLDPQNEKIIHPLICGSDTEKYFCNQPKVWLIYIPWHFPCQLDENIKGASLKAEEAFRNQYPILYSHLSQYKEQLSKRNLAETGIRYEWYAMQRWGSKYWMDFQKPKIIWQAISKRMAFAYDPSGDYYCDVTTYFMTGNNLKYILAILNSKLFEYALLKIYLEGDTFKSKNAIIQNFPVPPISETTDRLVELVDSIISTKQKAPSADTSTLESGIDRLVYQLYGLTEEEIKIVEGECSPKK